MHGAIRRILVGHPDAHEQARVLSRDARIAKKPLSQVLRESKELEPYLAKMSPEQLSVLTDPANYLGASVARTNALCDEWTATRRWASGHETGTG